MSDVGKGLGSKINRAQRYYEASTTTSFMVEL